MGRIVIWLCRAVSRLVTLCATALACLMFLYSVYALYDSLRIQRQALPEWGLSALRTEEDGDGTVSLAQLHEMNPDVVGWLRVDGTGIDYPVVRGEDDLHYAYTDVFGEPSLTGSIYLSCENDRSLREKYLMIYGHHMASGAMLGDLDLYLEEAFMRSHRTAALTTLEETLSVQFYACVLTDAYDEAFYAVADRQTTGTEELEAYIRERASVYLGTPGQEGGILCLSTCSDSATNGRLVLIGRVLRSISMEGTEGGAALWVDLGASGKAEEKTKSGNATRWKAAGMKKENEAGILSALACLAALYLLVPVGRLRVRLRAMAAAGGRVRLALMTGIEAVSVFCMFGVCRGAGYSMASLWQVRDALTPHLLLALAAVLVLDECAFAYAGRDEGEREENMTGNQRRLASLALAVMVMATVLPVWAEAPEMSVEQEAETQAAPDGASGENAAQAGVDEVSDEGVVQADPADEGGESEAQAEPDGMSEESGALTEPCAGPETEAGEQESSPGEGIPPEAEEEAACAEEDKTEEAGAPADGMPQEGMGQPEESGPEPGEAAVDEAVPEEGAGREDVHEGTVPPQEEAPEGDCEVEACLPEGALAETEADPQEDMVQAVPEETEVPACTESEAAVELPAPSGKEEPPAEREEDPAGDAGNRCTADLSELLSSVRLYRHGEAFEDEETWHVAHGDTVTLVLRFRARPDAGFAPGEMNYQFPDVFDFSDGAGTVCQAAANRGRLQVKAGSTGNISLVWDREGSSGEDAVTLTVKGVWRTRHEEVKWGPHVTRRIEYLSDAPGTEGQRRDETEPAVRADEATEDAAKAERTGDAADASLVITAVVSPQTEENPTGDTDVRERQLEGAYTDSFLGRQMLVRVSGQFPEDVRMTLAPASVAIPGEEVVLAFDIGFLDARGERYEPETPPEVRVELDRTWDEPLAFYRVTDRMMPRSTAFQIADDHLVFSAR